AVLAFAFVFELYSWKISYHQLQLRKDPDETVFDEILGSKDPTVFTVFLKTRPACLAPFWRSLEFFSLTGSILHIWILPHRYSSGFCSLRWRSCWGVRRARSWWESGPTAQKYAEFSRSSLRTPLSSVLENC